MVTVYKQKTVYGDFKNRPAVNSGAKNDEVEDNTSLQHRYTQYLCQPLKGICHKVGAARNRREQV